MNRHRFAAGTFSATLAACVLVGSFCGVERAAMAHDGAVARVASPGMNGLNPGDAAPCRGPCRPLFANLDREPLGDAPADLSLPVPNQLAGSARRLRFSGYAGGLHVASVTVDLAKQDGIYASRMDVRTEGILALFLDGHLAAAVHGESGGGRLQPHRYRTVDVFNGERNELDLDYGYRPDSLMVPGLPVRMDPDGRRDRLAGTPEKIPPEDRLGTLDPISALSLLMGLTDAQPAAGGRGPNCDRDFRIFDGKRRYDLSLGPAEPASLDRSPYNLHMGPAWRCAFDLKRGGGFRSRDQVYDNHLRSGVVWFGRPDDDLPITLVRIDTDSALSAVRIHLVGIDHPVENIAFPE